MATSSRRSRTGPEGSPPPTSPERDDSWVTEHVSETDSEDDSPSWTRRPIRLHDPEEVEAWKQLRDPEYWSRKFREEKEEQARRKIVSASSNEEGGEGGITDEAAGGGGSGASVDEVIETGTGSGTEENAGGDNSEQTPPPTPKVAILPASNVLVTVSARELIKFRHQSHILHEFRDFSLMRRPELQKEFHEYKLAQAQSSKAGRGGGGPTPASISTSLVVAKRGLPIMKKKKRPSPAPTPTPPKRTRVETDGANAKKTHVCKVCHEVFEKQGWLGWHTRLEHPGVASSRKSNNPPIQTEGPATSSTASTASTLQPSAVPAAPTAKSTSINPEVKVIQID